MSDTTARLALPFIAPGQAQKELAHNEALTRIDAALHAAALGFGADDPPASPAIGQSWIVGAAPMGDWAGQTQSLATWTEGGWRFVAPVAGMTVWLIAEGVFARHDGSAWSSGAWPVNGLTVAGVQVVGSRQSAVAIPIGGTVIDTEARAAISAVIAALSSHGLIAP